MRHAKWVGIIILFLSLVILTHYWYQNRQTPENKTTDVDSLSRAYELWTIQLDGAHTNPKCSGTYSEQISIQVLYPDSLTSQLAKIPSTQPVTISGNGVFASQERVERQSKVKRQSLVPAQIQDLNVQVQSSWMVENGQSRLRSVISASQSLLPGRCIIRDSMHTTEIMNIILIGTNFQRNAIEGQWFTNDDPNPRGRFIQQWTAGGGSSHPLPGPTDLQALAATGNVTVKWKAYPGADSYEVYLLKQPTLSTENLLRIIPTTKENFAIITDLDESTVYSFAVAPVFSKGKGNLSSIVLAKPSAPLVADAVATGDRHACAIFRAGQVICWGANDHGQVDERNKTTWSFPTQVPDILQAKTISANGNTTCVKFADNHEKCWGENLGTKTTSQDEPPSRDFNCRQLSNSSIRCSGDNSVGQLGTGDQIPSAAPAEPPYLSTEEIRPSSLKVGQNFACVLNRAGNVICWGANHFGQLGNGSGTFSPTPQLVRQ